MTTTCPQCHYTRQPSDTAPDYECPSCGIVYAKAKPAKVAEAPAAPPPKTKGLDEKFCIECGEIIKAKAEICPKCGVRQMPAERTEGKKQKFTAGLIALFLCGLGFHKFYLDRPYQGIAYLLLCWTFVPALIALVEGLNYLTMSQKIFDQRYN